MSDALRNLRTDTTLALGRLPHRKQACFYFESGNELIPVAYVREERIVEAEKLWGQLLDGIPVKEDKCTG